MIVSCSVQNINKPDYSNPLKMLHPATMKSSIALSSSTSEERKKMFTTLTVPVLQKSLYQNKVDNLRISMVIQSFLSLKYQAKKGLYDHWYFLWTNFLSMWPPVVWYHLHSIYCQIFSAVIGSHVGKIL